VAPSGLGERRNDKTRTAMRLSRVPSQAGKLLAGWLASSIHNPHDFIDLAIVILSIWSLLLGVVSVP
jgi:hypothetical protein